MKIITTLFKYPKYPHVYDHLHAVLLVSCKKYMPSVEIVTLSVDTSVENNDRHIGYAANTVKLKAINKYVQRADEDLLILDADIMCIGDANCIFENDFDIAFTMRTDYNPGEPNINGGVIAVRNTREAKDWFNNFAQLNNMFYNEKDLHMIWKKKFPGMNQAAMGCMIYGPGRDHPARVIEYKTRRFNAVDCDWNYIDEKTVFVHCKGVLRDSIENNSGPAVLEQIVKRWYNYLDETNYSRDDGEKREYMVKEINLRDKKLRGPYTRYRHGKCGRYRRYRKR